MVRALPASIALLILSSCADPEPATEVLVVFEADQAVQRLARDIEIVVFGGERGTALPAENEQELSFNVADIGGWPVSHTLVPTGADATRLYRVEGRLYDGVDSQPIATVRAISGYLEGRSLVLRLRFYAECLYVEACEDPDFSCNANGNCQPARVDPRGLVENPGGPLVDGGLEPVCRTDLDCDDGISCTDDVCFRSECVNQPRHDFCTDFADGFCDGQNGCQYGDCDAGPGGNCVATDCELARCDGTTCVRMARCPRGVACCGGTCGTCNDGQACTTDACDATAGNCTNVVGAGGSCDDAVFCNGTGTCAADGNCTASGMSPCTGALTCDESTRSCVGCVTDADCPAPSMGGGTECVGAADATPDQVCAGRGERTVTTTTYACTAGSCVPSETTGPATCTVPDTDNDICDTSTTTWGACQFSMTCSRSGSMTGTTTAWLCAGGACVMSPDPSTTVRSCSRATLPPICTPDGGMDAGTPDSGMDSSFDTSTPETGPSDTGVDTSMDTSTPETGPSDTGVDTSMDTSTPETSIPRGDSMVGLDAA